MHTVFVNHLIAVSQFSHLLFSPPTASSCYPELCGKVQSWETERATSPSWQLYFHHQHCTQQTTWRLWGKTCFLFPFLFNWMSVWRSGNTLVSFRCDPDLISGISEHVKLSCGHQVGAVGFLWVLRFSLGTLVSSGYSGFLWVLRFPLGTPVSSRYSGFLLVLRFPLGTPVSSHMQTTQKQDISDNVRIKILKNSFRCKVNKNYFIIFVYKESIEYLYEKIIQCYLLWFDSCQLIKKNSINSEQQMTPLYNYIYYISFKENIIWIFADSNFVFVK